MTRDQRAAMHEILAMRHGARVLIAEVWERYDLTHEAMRDVLCALETAHEIVTLRLDDPRDELLAGGNRARAFASVVRISSVPHLAFRRI